MEGNTKSAILVVTYVWRHTAHTWALCGMLWDRLPMKRTTIIILLLFLTNNGWTDIAPNPIILKSIMTNRPCEVQMVSETVDINLYSDSSFVSCTFNMMNHGDSLTLAVGFPVMNFFHWSISPYDKQDKDKFEIYVDNLKLNQADIQVPQEMKGTYDKYMRVIHVEEEYKRKLDSVNTHFGVIEERKWTKITTGSFSEFEQAQNNVSKWREKQPYLDSDLMLEFDSLMAVGDYAWYIWKVKFQKDESKTIKVNYMVPSGIGYGGEYRFMKYLLSTGSGWKDRINNAQINIKLDNVKINTLETISPSNYKLDKKAKTISWTFVDLEPTTDNDIYVKYYNPSERRKWENFKEKRTRQLSK